MESTREHHRWVRPYPPQQYPAHLVHLVWMVLEMRCRWPYNCYFVGCCFQDLFDTTHSILVQLLLSFFSICLVSVHVVHPYSSMDMTAAWKKLCFILLDRSDFHLIDNLSLADYLIDNLSLADHAFAYWCHFFIDKTLLPRKMNLSTSFKGPPFSVEMSPL